MTQNRTVYRIVRLVVLVGLVLALTLALPGSTDAATFNEVKKLTASDAMRGDRLGWSAAISGDVVVVGTSSAEAAYVFQRDHGGSDAWGEVKKLTRSGTEDGDQFGVSVAISGDTAIVGAWAEDAGAGGNSGAAYLFQRNQGGANNWGEVKKLTPSDAQLQDHFGYSVAISGNTVLVGARQFLEGTTGVAYVFQRDKGGSDNWGEAKKLTASDAQESAAFGWNVAISGDTAVVVALLVRAAYVFERDEGGAGNWGEVKKLTGSDTQASDDFGISMALGTDTTIVGAWRNSSAGDNAGAAYVFGRNHGGTNNWGEVAKLTASDAQPQDQFGVGVATSGDTAIVGAHEKAGFNAGVAYVFEQNEGGVDSWGEVKKLTSSDGQSDDALGWSVALNGDTAVVGAIGEDGSGPIGFSSGAAYVFAMQPGQPRLVTPTTVAPTALATAIEPATPTVALKPAVLPETGMTLKASEPRGSHWGLAASIVAAAGVVGGAAWYAGRRRLG